MIIFGGNELIPYLILDNSMPEQKFFKCNFMNLCALGTSVNGIWPINTIFQAAEVGSIEFDRSYYNYLINCNEAFVSFMLIIMGDYFNDGTFVLTDLNNELVYNMVDSIVKIIQIRYGLNCSIIQTEEDLNYISESEMSEEGYRQFMIDKERYTYLTTDPKELMKELDKVDGINGKRI